MLNFLGQQEAARKTRPPVHPTPGAWTRKLFWNDSHLGLYILSSQEKWDRLKELIAGWYNMYFQPNASTVLNICLEVLFDRKQMEKERGFLIHMAEVYPMLVPYLKGIHLTLESWQPDQDQE
eukprot:10238654-Ditylum_brightwellii.AAC.1